MIGYLEKECLAPDYSTLIADFEPNKTMSLNNSYSDGQFYTLAEFEQNAIILQYTIYYNVVK